MNPAILVEEVISELQKHFNVTLTEHTEVEEKVRFPLPAAGWFNIGLNTLITARDEWLGLDGSYLVAGITKTFVPFYSSFPEIFYNFALWIIVSC